MRKVTWVMPTKTGRNRGTNWDAPGRNVCLQCVAQSDARRSESSTNRLHQSAGRGIMLDAQNGGGNMPTPAAGRPQVTRDDAQRAARLILEARPLSERALRAALKAQRIALSVEQVADLLGDDQFVLGGDGRWRLAERRTASDGAMNWPAAESVAHLTYRELAARVNVTERELRELLPILERVRPDVDWLALDRRLRTDVAVAIRDTTVEAVRAALATRSALRRTHVREQQPLTHQTPAPSSAESSSANERGGGEDAAAQSLRARLEAQVRAAERDREAAEVARRQAESAMQDLVRERQAEIVERARRVRQADEAKQRAIADEVQSRHKAGRRSRASARPVRRTLLGWEQSNCGWMYAVGAPTTEGERELQRQLRDLTGIVVLNCQLWDGAKEREVDAIVIHPRGIVTIEQKDIGRPNAGLLEVPLNGPVTVAGQEVGHDRARQQARLGAQMLASVAKHEPKLDVGFITAFMAFNGDLELEPQLQQGNVRVCLTGAITGTLEDYFSSRESTVTLSVAQGVLRRLEVPGAVDSRFATLGFRTG